MNESKVSEIEVPRTTEGPWSKAQEDLKLFIGGVPSSLTNKEIESHFEVFGKVRRFQRLPTKEKQESGCGVLEIVTCFKQELLQQPQIIKSYLLNCELAGSFESVNKRKLEELQRKIFVSNLPTRTTDLDLYNTFSPFGAVEKAFVVKNRDGSLKNFGFVVFSSGEAMNKVISLNQLIRFRNRKLAVKQATEDASKPLPLVAPEEYKPLPPKVTKPVICTQATPLMQVRALSTYLNTSIDNYRLNISITYSKYTLK